MNLSGVAVCIFDVNGVLIDSNAANARAMAEAFDAPRELRPRLQATYLRLTGIDRGEKIRIVQQTVIGRPFREGEFQTIWNRFKRLAGESMTKAPLMPGVRAVLNQLGKQGITRAALSNTPVEELERILALHDLDGMLEIVRGGGDWPKFESLAKLLREFRFDPASCLFFGDGKGDLSAARLAGVPFVAIDPSMEEFRGETDVRGPYASLEEWHSKLQGSVLPRAF
ncbi:MAG: HAD family hydrolase [Deltaproteobacteria bacterium]|nr:HAD family hydrolase [Deltaproteobacteria bacterium]